MEATNASNTKHPRLDGRSRGIYRLDECDQAVIARAIGKAQRGETAWTKQPHSEGAALGERTITDAVLRYRIDGSDQTLDEERDVSDPSKAYVPKTDDGRPQRAERVWVEATIEGNAGGSEKVEIETDLALLDPDEHWPTEFGIALSADTEMNIDELVEMLIHACFQPRDGRDEDSAETQRDDFEDHALWIATTLLLPRREALERQMENKVRRCGANLVNEGEIATITVVNHRGSGGKREVQATVRCL